MDRLKLVNTYTVIFIPKMLMIEIHHKSEEKYIWRIECVNY